MSKDEILIATEAKIFEIAEKFVDEVGYGTRKDLATELSALIQFYRFGSNRLLQ